MSATTAGSSINCPEWADSVYATAGSSTKVISRIEPYMSGCIPLEKGIT